MVARHLRNDVGWNARDITEWFVVMPHDVLDYTADVGSHDELVMVRIEVPCRYPRMLKLVEARFAEPDRKGGYRPVHLLSHHRDHRARINPPREERSERHIADQSQLHRFC